MENISERIVAFNSDRLPRLITIKYEAMMENHFRFFRGTNHIFYEDASTAVLPDSPVCWISGDLHLENFGTYKSDNRLVYFDLNDFDEAVLAPVALELARLATSIFIGFESLKMEHDKALHMAKLFLKTYSATLAKGKPNYIEPKTAKGIVAEFLSAASKRGQKEILAKKTLLSKNRIEILLDDARHLKLKAELKEELCQHIGTWLKNDEHSPYNYIVKDAVFRVAGTGSLGVKRYAFLLKSLKTFWSGF